MIRTIQTCEKCEKEYLSSDDGDGILEINYKKKIIQFICPCGFINVLDFGDIKASLERKTKLPSIRGSRY